MSIVKDIKLKVEYWPLSKLKPYPNNPKIHPENQIIQLMESIKRFGMNDPIGIVDKPNEIIEGHGRLIACNRLGLKTVPIIKLNHLNKHQRVEYRIAHNKLSANGYFDVDKILAELKLVADIKYTGFTDEEIEALKIDTDNMMNTFSGGLKNLSDESSITLNYDKKYETRMKDYIKEHGKKKLEKMLIEVICQ